jgi:hypothetical protein
MGPISLFYSYSHRDEAFRQDLEAHLSFLRRASLIAEWHDLPSKRLNDVGFRLAWTLSPFDLYS